ncbi:MAG: nucleotidyltransferase domain-containing protein, partial [Chloroflexota bacterium]
MENINLGNLENGPHANLIRQIAERCAADERIQAVWVGGSLASGTGDDFSDVDLRLAVEPATLGDWTDPDWDRYLPIMPSGSTLM